MSQIPQDLDPARMTPEQLHIHVNSIITKGYGELSTYDFVMEDLLTKGVSYYILDLNKARAWNNRVLGMLQEIRRLASVVTRIAVGKQRILEVAMGDWLTTTKREQLLPKGLDATERRCLARRACVEQEQDAETWDELVKAVDFYIKCLDDKQKDLAKVKEDLRTQLWAVRVHGVLGELARDGETGSFSQDPVGVVGPPLRKTHARAYSDVDSQREPLSEDPDISRLLDS